MNESVTTTSYVRRGCIGICRGTSGGFGIGGSDCRIQGWGVGEWDRGDVLRGGRLRSYGGG